MAEAQATLGFSVVGLDAIINAFRVITAQADRTSKKLANKAVISALKAEALMLDKIAAKEKRVLELKRSVAAQARVRGGGAGPLVSDRVASQTRERLAKTTLELVKMRAQLDQVKIKGKDALLTLAGAASTATKRSRDLALIQATIKAGMLQFSSSARTIGEATIRVAALTKRYDDLGARIKTARIELERAAREGRGLKRLETSTNKLYLLWVKTENQLKRSRKQLEAFNREGVKGSAAATSGFARQQKAIQDIGSRLGIAIQKIITYRIAFGVWRQVVEQLKDVVVQTIKIDDAMQDLKKVMSGTQPVFDQLQKQAFSFGIKFGRSINEVIDGFKIFAQQGLSVDEIIGRMHTTMLAISGSTLTASQAIEALTAVVKNFPEFQDNLTSAVDKWTKVAATAPVTAQDLANAVKNVGISAHQAGLDLDELNGIIAAVAEVTRQSGTAIGNSFKTIFARFPRKKTILALQELGVLALESSGQMRGFGKVMRDLKDRWGDITDIQKKNFAQVVGGIRRYKDFLALMSNFDTFTRQTIQSQLSLGFAQEAAGHETDKLSRQLQMVGTQFEKLKVSIGEGGLTGEYVDLIKWVNKLLISWDANGGRLASLISNYLKYGSVLGIVFIAITTLIGTITKLTTTMETMSIVSRGASTSILGFAGAARTAIGALGVIGLVLAAAGLAWSLFSSGTDDAAIKLAAFNDEMAEHNRKLSEFQRNAATAAGPEAEKEFKQAAKLAQLEKNLAVYTKAVDKLQAQEDRVRKIQTTPIRTSRMGGGGPGISFTISADVPQAKKDAKALAAANDFLGKTFTNLDNALWEMQRRGNLERLSGELLKAEVDFSLGIITIKEYVNALKELRTVDYQSTITKLEELRRQVSQDLTNKEVVRRFSNFGEVVVETTEAIKRAVDALPGRINVLKGSIDKINKAFDNVGKVGSDKTFRIIDNFGTTDKIISKIKTNLSGLKAGITDSADRAALMGDRFDKVGATINKLAGQFKATSDARRNLISRSNVLQAEILANHILEGVEIKEIISLQGQKNEMLKIQGKLLSKQVDKEGTESKEAGSKIREFIALVQEQYRAMSALLSLEKEIGGLQKITLGDLEKQLSKRNELTNSLEITQRNYKIEKRLIGDFAISQKQILVDGLKRVQIEKNIALSQQKSDAAIKSIVSGQARIKAEKDKESRTQTIINNAKEKELALLQAQGDQIRENIKQLKLSVLSALSSGIATIPLQLVTRKEDLDKLKDEEEAAIRELTRARIESDSEATLSAVENLRRIRYEIEQTSALIPNILGPFLDQLSQIRMDNLAEQLTAAMSTEGTGNFIADGITTASQMGAELYYVAIISASKDGAEFASLLKKHTDGEGARRWKTALESGGAIAAQLLGQAIGGGGKNASRFANLGAIFGQAAALKLSGAALAGPLGLIAGSIFGGLFGKQYDKDFEARDANTSAIKSNTTVVENNNKLLEQNRQFINAPTRFNAPPLSGNFGGGGAAPVNVIVNIDNEGVVTTSVISEYAFNSQLTGTQPRTFINN